LLLLLLALLLPLQMTLLSVRVVVVNLGRNNRRPAAATLSTHFD
jgi:hypothetical protein